jgi:ATP-dependent DNA ligase
MDEEGKMMPFGMNKGVALNHENNNYKLCYKIFDILWLRVENEEMNLMGYPLRERKKILPKVINEVPGRVELVKFREILEYDDILREFNASLERNE